MSIQAKSTKIMQYTTADIYQNLHQNEPGTTGKIPTEAKSRKQPVLDTGLQKRLFVLVATGLFLFTHSVDK